LVLRGSPGRLLVHRRRLIPLSLLGRWIMALWWWVVLLLARISGAWIALLWLGVVSKADVFLQLIEFLLKRVEEAHAE
jgi:hypothetical protein